MKSLAHFLLTVNLKRAYNANVHAKKQVYLQNKLREKHTECTRKENNTRASMHHKCLQHCPNEKKSINMSENIIRTLPKISAAENQEAKRKERSPKRMKKLSCIYIN